MKQSRLSRQERSTETHARVFGALSDPVRLRFVQEVMKAGEATGTEVAERLGISLALLCHHAKILVDAGVLDKRKEGQTSYYRTEPRTLETTFGLLAPHGGEGTAAARAKERTARK